MTRSRTGWLWCGLAALGCASATPQPAVPREHWVPAYVFGIWGKADVDVRDDCPDTNAASVRVGPTWTTLLVSIASIGMYTPRVVRVSCQAKP